MPELPEVEFARRALEHAMRGRRIKRVMVHDPRVVVGEPAAFVRALKSASIEVVSRRGKQLRIELKRPAPKRGEAKPLLLFSHLGMTGKWVERQVEDPLERFEKVRIDLERKGKTSSMRYLDPRLLGSMRAAEKDPPSFLALGPDPLLEGIDPAYLKKKLSARKKSIKETIMDQTVLAGIGNIQATEALWRAKIHPETPANALSAAKVSSLVRAIKASLEMTFAAQAGPAITYVEEAKASNPFLVYGRSKKPCPRCKTPLTRIVLGGRGTVFCPKCQPSP